MISGGSRLGGEALAPQVFYQFLLPGVDRRQRAGYPAEQQVGQARIADERGAMQVGAYHPARIGALRSIPVADSRHHRGQRLDGRAATGNALVVLEAGQPLDAKRRVDVGDDLADPAPLAAAAADVEQAEAGDRLSLGPAELRPDDLVASADREHDRAPPDRRGQPAGRAQPAGGEHLRQVFAAAQQVNVAVYGNPLVGVDLGYLDRQAA